MTQTSSPPSIDELRAQVSRMLDALPPQTPISATVLFKVARAQEQLFLHNAEVLREATLKLPGVQVFGYHKQIPIKPSNGHGHRPAADPEYLIYEEWDTRDHFRAQWDSVHIFQFQVSVGALLVAFPDLSFYTGTSSPVAHATRPLRTGQARCWDSDGRPIDCAGSGQDAEYQTGVPFPDQRFTDPGDGTVIDELTGLIWLKDANRYGELPWAQAIEACQKLGAGTEGLDDGSQPGDWRLPNVIEFLSLLELNNTSGVPLHPRHPFKRLHPANYWTSSSVPSAPALGWFLSLAVGPHVFDLKVNPMRVWPVRGKGNGRVAQTGQTHCFDPVGAPISCAGSGQDGEIRAGVPFPSPRFDDRRDGTVRDNLTGLTWLRDAGVLGNRSWHRALEACHSLADGAAGLSDDSRPGDWRLPNINELRSLINFDNADPALPEGHPFREVRPSLYWSSTTVASAPNQARFVFVGLGPSVWDHKSVEMGVWPVRGGR